MTEVALFSTSGGLLAEALIQDLRLENVVGDAKFLADVAGFRGLDDHVPTRAQHDNDLEAAFKSAQALWAVFANELDAGVEVSRLRERLLRPLLESLGFHPAFQRAKLAAGDGTWAISHLGWDDPAAAPLMLVADRDLDRADGGRRRSAHDEIQGYLNAADQQWGVLTNGRVLRVLRDFHHSRTRGYVQFDLAAILEAGSLPEFRALWRLAHVSRFLATEVMEHPVSATDEGEDDTDDEDGDTEAGAAVEVVTLLERLYRLSVSAGVAAGKRLQPQVRRAIEEFANGVLEANPAVRQRMADEARFGRDLYRELLTWLYRILFLLFAEQRGMLLGATDLYDETYALTRLRTVAESGDVEGRRGDLWEGMKLTFAAFSDPAQAQALGVYPYNGQLFDPDRTPILRSARCPNWRVVTAIRSLTTMQVDSKVSLHVDWRNLGVEELGTVYESLLDYTLKTADAPVLSGRRVIEPGQAYLASLSTERADLASYYTPPALVRLVLDRALEPLLVERLAAAGPDSAARQQAILDLRIVDPACGSGAFLVGVIDRLADYFAHARTQPAEPADHDLASARRKVLSRCIYGADKDPFAVELCKVALWIHCAVPDAPLSFLDAHIICGDSLVGWPLTEIPDHINPDAYTFNKGTSDDKKILTAARSTNAGDLGGVGNLFTGFAALAPGSLTLPSILDAPEDTFVAVREKAAAYDGYLASRGYGEKRAAANLWTATFFWTANHGPAPATGDYRNALNGDASAGLIEQADEIVEVLTPLHWALAFPDIRDRGGFDLVIGNPPWEQFKGTEQEFFRSSAPNIAAMTSETRGQAIAALEETDPALHRQWTDYKAAQDRLAHWAKTSGRYTRTSSEANTYVLFTEHAADLAGARGRVGLVVKSGIATDAAQSPVWRKLLLDGRVREVTDIVNSGPGGARVFPAVAAVERFTVLVLGPKRDETTFSASMMNFGVEAANDNAPRSWDETLLSRCCPVTKTLLSVGNPVELDLALALHDGWHTLDFDEPNGKNPWGISYHRLFDSSGAKKSGLLVRPEALSADGWVHEDDKTMSHPDGRRALPVYEGQMANRWDHRARTYQGYKGANKYGRKPHIPWVTDDQHADTGFETEPRYWMFEAISSARISETIGDRSVVAFRDVTRPWTDRRSMKAALLPRYPATHTLPVFAVPVGHVTRFLALTNSTVFDFLIRVHLPGGHVTPWLVSQVAGPGPHQIDRKCGALAETLTSTSASLAAEYGLTLRQWNSKERASIEAECDARIARSYGLGRASYETVLDHFQLLARIETKEHGEYRTKRLCLDAFDRLAMEA